MKFIEYLHEMYLREIHLREMAFDRNKAEERITGLGGPIVLHLIKVVRYSDPSNDSKHIVDIQNWLLQVASISLKRGKKISADDYFKWMIADQKLSTRLVKGVDANYGSLPRKSDMHSDQNVVDRVNEIGLALSRDLADDSVIDVRKYL